MSDQPNPKPSPNRAPQEPRPFNWKALLLSAMALILVGVLIANPSPLSTGTEVMKYTEFLRYLDQGRVIVKDDKNPKYALKLISSDYSGDMVIGGYLKPELKAPAQPDKATYPFKVLVNLKAKSKEWESLNDRVKLPVYEVANRDGLPGSSGDTREFRELGIEEFLKAYAFNEIHGAGSANPVAAYTAPNSDMVLIVGVRDEIKNRVPATDSKGKELAPQYFEVKSSTELQRAELNSLVDQGATIQRNNDYLGKAIFTFLPFLLLILLLFFLFRQQMKASGRGAMSFGKSKARLLTMDRNKVTFKDVAGIQEAKEELWEIVDFLRDPRKFQKLGGSIPKGVLMVGSPGTGKTLLARAIAGEADVPFFSISGSDFVEMFVGVGASRVRDMFEQGKKHAPCLIFIDEIDAVGRHRGHGMGGGHDEREQTLNQLLVEMDGFDTQEGVIIIAATNRPDVLDPALLRPGRFDRQVTVSLPDVNGREEILKVHVKKIKLTAGTDLAVIARGTPGFSGAELANLVNEAALLAARKGLSAVTIAEMEEARDKVRWGRERRSLAMSDKEKTATAWHEAGHAILLAKLEYAQPLHKVTIIPRGPSLGSTMWLPEGDRYSKARKEALDDLAVAVGGRIAESFYTNDVSNGASGDIRMATNLARTMVCAWGMSDKLGMVEYGDDDSPVFLARDMSRGRNYSEETARLIDAEIKRLVDEAFERATKLLTEYKDKVELLAKALLDYETLDAAHVCEILETGEMKNPPTTPKPPPIPDEFRKGDAPKPKDEEKPDDNGTLPGEVVGAPA